MRELAVAITYKGRRVAWQRLDMIVDDKIIIEVKSAELLAPYAKRQLLSYLRASKYEVGLLLHCGPEPRFSRLVDTNKSPFARARDRSSRSRPPPL